MKIIKKTINILFFCFVFNHANADIISGRVVGVSDGDTITVLDNLNTQYKIRLAGIDAPEKKQPFGNVSKQSLSNLVYNKQVNVDWVKQDSYGRTVGKVIVNGLNANLEQVKLGMAWYYKKYQNELVLDDRLDYLHAQEAASNSKVGLWVDKEPVAPWDFRKNRHSN
jgi:endonuclease YncB( thermonuclease family)